ncbi:hypothetical protein [Streptococcus sobrinus]|uniref:hypothetical protein n=1 Tax=Streptococcus sobrinus TaxID=1310 RepID=UPI000407510A|nr:hypothetical protein [Streptococcus sobrinus]SQG12785.1 putative integrase protein [Streptococcus sobrinus]
MSSRTEIEDCLKSSWSPEQIYGRYQLENKPMFCFKTIYNWLYKGLIDYELAFLRRKDKSRQFQEKRGKFIIGALISKHPKGVRTRKTVGHWVVIFTLQMLILLGKEKARKMPMAY